jgi:tetratricopeptide (TPR) repeat protein
MPCLSPPLDKLIENVEQLQRNPSDTALREKIIKLAQELKPAPAVPEEAERRMARGTAAFKGAKSVADYRDAAKEFEQATIAAPWYGDAYHNLGVAQDKAEQYEAALRSLKLALLASPDNKEIKGIIYEVEYRNEKANSPEVRAAQEKEKQDAFLRSLDGAKFVRYSLKEGQYNEAFVLEVRGTTIITKKRLMWATPETVKMRQHIGFRPNIIGEEMEIGCRLLTYQMGTVANDGRIQWKNGQFVCRMVKH